MQNRNHCITEVTGIRLDPRDDFTVMELLELGTSGDDQEQHSLGVNLVSAQSLNTSDDSDVVRGTRQHG